MANAIKLTEEQLTKLGNELTEIMTMLEMSTNMAEALSFIHLKDDIAFSEQAQSFLNTFREQFSVKKETLDEIAFLLLNSTDKEELATSVILK